MVTHRLATIAIAATALALVSCSSTLEPEDPAKTPTGPTIEGALTSDQIKSLIIGNTGYGQEEKFQWRTYYASDGTARGRIWGTFGQERDQGNWEVTPESQLCRQWRQKWGNRKRACFEIYKDGEQVKLINIDGNADSYEMMIVSGDKVE